MRKFGTKQIGVGKMLDERLNEGGVFFTAPEGIMKKKHCANSILCCNIDSDYDIFTKFDADSIPLDEDKAMGAMQDLSFYIPPSKNPLHWPFIICESCGHKVGVDTSHFVNRHLDILIFAFRKLGGVVHHCADGFWRLTECRSCVA